MQTFSGSLLALVLLAAGTVSAQLPELQSGTRVRIRTTGTRSPLIGTVAYQTPSELGVLRAAGDTATVSLAAISRVDMSGGRRSNAMPGAKMGAVTGATLGAMFGVVLLAADSWLDYGAEVIPISMLGGGILGGGVGLLVGAVTSSERWLPANGLVAVTPAAGGAAVSASFRF
jgi:hypothetical protein